MNTTDGIFESILLLLASAVFIIILFRRLRLPAIVGYLCIGVILGPYAAGLIEDHQVTKDIAEFGIVFLLFMIGLEFSVKKLLAMKQTVLGYGGLQVGIAILVSTLVGVNLGMTLQSAIVVGSIVAMSSTAIVLRELTDRKETGLTFSQNAIGILLFQDIAAVPLLILIPALAGAESGSLTFTLGFSALKGLLAIGILLVLGRVVLRPVFREIHEIKSQELFTLSALLVTLGCAWISHTLGLSLALGGFLAGMMLGETQYRQQIENDVRPFRDVFLGLFFITIGAQFDVSILSSGWMWLLLLFSALVIFKTLLITGLGLVFKHQKTTALSTGLVLAHGGEFGLAILSLAMTYDLLPKEYGQMMLGAIILSMAVTPFMIRHHERVVKLLVPNL